MMSLSYEEMLDLTEEKLEKMGVTKVNIVSDVKSISFIVNYLRLVLLFQIIKNNFHQ